MFSLLLQIFLKRFRERTWVTFLVSAGLPRHNFFFGDGPGALPQLTSAAAARLQFCFRFHPARSVLPPWQFGFFPVTVPLIFLSVFSNHINRRPCGPRRVRPDDINTMSFTTLLSAICSGKRHSIYVIKTVIRGSDY